MDKRLWGFMTIFLSSFFQVALGLYSSTQETTIRNHIFAADNYDSMSRPASLTNIKVTLALTAIDELDIRGQSLTGAGWIAIEWNDPRLSWTPASFSDIKEVVIEQSKIWKPQLLVDNNIDEVDVFTESNLYLRNNYQGKIEWLLPLFFKVHCKVDITYYPYDRQKCSIDISSWSYNVEEVTLEAASTAINLEDFEENGEWTVTKTAVELIHVTKMSNSQVITINPQLKFQINLQRRSTFYILNEMIPTICTSVLVDFVFVLPEESGQKLYFILTFFLSIAVLLTSFADLLPPTSSTVSVLGLYLTTVLLHSALAILCTVIIVILARRETPVRKSNFLLEFTYIVAILMRHPLAQKIKDFNEAEESTNNSDADSNAARERIQEINLQWSELSQVLDKFFSTIFFTESLLINGAYLLALTQGARGVE